MNEPEYGPPTGEPIYLPPSATPKRKIWPWVLGVVLFLALLMFAGCGFLGYRLLKSPTGTGTFFATAIQQEDYAVAYDSLCQRSKDEITFEEFSMEHVPAQEVDSVEPVTISFSGEGDSDEYVVVYVLADGTRKTVAYPLAKEGGEWHVCMPPKF